MAVIDPPDTKFASLKWTLVQPTQVNRSEFTSARQVAQLPGASYWRAEAARAPIVGEANLRTWRSFLAKLAGSASSFALPATESAQNAIAFAPAGPSIDVANAANMTFVAAAVPKVYTATKAAGGAAWNASVKGSAPAVGGAHAVFRPLQTTAEFAIGLTRFPDASLSFDFDYALMCRETGILQIYEAGALVGSYGAYLTTDVLGVVYDDAADTIGYYRNGALLRSVSVASGLSLYLDSSFFTAGAQALLSFAGAAFSAPGALALGLIMPASALALSEGQYATALCYGGGAQLLVATASASADASGNASLAVAPALRKKAWAVIVDRPYGLMAMDGPELGYGVAPGQIYDLAAFQCTEAF